MSLAELAERLCKQMPELGRIWHPLGQAARLVESRLTLLLGRVSFSRSGHHIPSKCNEPRSRGHASYARVQRHQG